MVGEQRAGARRRTTRRSVWMALAVVGLVGCSAKVVDFKDDPPAEVQADLMTRWNAAAEGVTIGLSGTTLMFNFLWTTYDQFPTPRSKGGAKRPTSGSRTSWWRFTNRATISPF